MENYTDKIKVGLLPHRFRQKGMTLLEVVVSMLVIGLGLVISISMLQTANRFGDNAEFSHSALEQAQAIIDKMRANRVASPTYIYTGGANITSTTAGFDVIYDSVRDENGYERGIDGLTITCLRGITTAGFSANDCKKAGLIAKDDMRAWGKNIRAILPGGRGLISHQNGTYEVIVLWSNTPESDSQNNPVAQGVRVSFTL